MKPLALLTLVAVVALAAGCTSTRSSSGPSAGGSSAPASSSPSGVDTSRLVAAFKTSDVPSNQLVARVVEAVGSRSWRSATDSLTQLLRYPGLTAEQESAVKSLLSVVSTRG